MESLLLEHDFGRDAVSAFIALSSSAPERAINNRDNLPHEVATVVDDVQDGFVVRWMSEKTIAPLEELRGPNHAKATGDSRESLRTLLEDRQQRIDNLRAYVPLEYIEVLHGRVCHFEYKVADEAEFRVTFYLTYGPCTAQGDAMVALAKDMKWNSPSAASGQPTRNQQAGTVKVNQPNNGCVVFFAIDRSFLARMLGITQEAAEAQNSTFDEFIDNFKKALGLKNTHDILESAQLLDQSVRNALNDIRFNQSQRNGFRFKGNRNQLYRVLPLCARSMDRAQGDGQSPQNKIARTHAARRVVQSQLSIFYNIEQEPDPDEEIYNNNIEMPEFKETSLWPRRLLYHLSQLKFPRAARRPRRAANSDDSGWAHSVFIKTWSENHELMVRCGDVTEETLGDLVMNDDATEVAFTHSGDKRNSENFQVSWRPISTRRDALAHKLHHTEANHLYFLWTSMGMRVHERLYAYAIMPPLDGPGNHIVLSPEVYEHYNAVDRAHSMDNSPVPPVVTNEQAAGDAEAPSARSLTRDLVFPHATPSIVGGQGGANPVFAFEHYVWMPTLLRWHQPVVCRRSEETVPLSITNFEYRWATQPLQQDEVSLVAAYADNAWAALHTFFDLKLREFVELTDEEFEALEGQWNTEVTPVAAECSVFWPYGVHSKSHNDQEYKGYETRIDCVVKVVYTDRHNQALLAQDKPPIIVVVEYKSRMEQQSRAMRGDDDIGARFRFLQAAKLRNADKLQAELNGLLLALCTDVQPTHSIVIQTTRRQTLVPFEAEGHMNDDVLNFVRQHAGATNVEREFYIPVAYVSCHKLDFHTKHFFNLLVNMFLRPYGNATRCVYIDKFYFVEDVDALLEAVGTPFSPKQDSTPQGVDALMALWEIMPRMELMWTYKELCDASYTRAGSPRQCFYIDTLKMYFRVGGAHDPRDRRSSREACYAENLILSLPRQYRSYANRYNNDPAANLVSPVARLVIETADPRITVSTYAEHRERPLVRDGWFYCVKTLGQFLLVCRAGGTFNNVNADLLPSSTGVVPRYFSRLFRSGVVVPFRTDHKCRKYPANEPPECKEIRQAITNRIAKLALAFFSMPGGEGHNLLWDNSENPLKDTIRGMNHVDFFAHSVVSIVRRSSSLNRLEEPDVARCEFAGWQSLLDDIGFAPQPDSDMFNWLAYNTNNLNDPNYTEFYSPMHRLSNSDEATEAEKVLWHKYTSFIRAVQRLVNQRLLNGFAAIMGVERETLLRDAHQLVNTYLSDFAANDRVTYTVDGYQVDDFPIDRFTHLSQRALWSHGALSAVWIQTMLGAHDGTSVVDIAAQHVADDLKFVAYSLYRQQHRNTRSRDIGSQNGRLTAYRERMWDPAR